MLNELIKISLFLLVNFMYTLLSALILTSNSLDSNLWILIPYLVVVILIGSAILYKSTECLIDNW